MKLLILITSIILFPLTTMAQTSIGYSLVAGSTENEICVKVTPAGGNNCLESGSVALVVNSIVSITQTSNTSWSPSTSLFTDLEGCGCTAFQISSGSRANLSISGSTIFCFTSEPIDPCAPRAFTSARIPSQNSNTPVDVTLRAGGLLTVANSSNCGSNTDGNSWNESGSSRSLELVCTLLPVELIHFKAQAQSNESTLVHWQTANELNNDFFQIEHSTNGIDFDAIGIQSGAGTTTQVQNYSFTHQNPTLGINYYRLKQTDFDGSFEYSNIESVYFENNGLSEASFKVFPNPSDDYLMIIPPTTNQTSWNLDIYDIQGKRMSSFMINDATYKLDTSNWPGGVYHIQVQNGPIMDQLKFVKN